MGPKPRSAAKTKELVLRALAAGRTLTEICTGTRDGPTRQQVLQWRDTDKVFAEGYAKALLQAGPAFADRAVALGKKLTELAMSGQLTPEISKALAVEIATLRWMAAQHGLRAPSGDPAETGDELESPYRVNVHIFIPDNERDPELAGPSEIERRHHRQRRQAEISYRDRRLRVWVEAGELSEGQALLAPSLWILPADAPWISLPAGMKEQKPLIPYFPEPEAAFSGG